MKACECDSGRQCMSEYEHMIHHQCLGPLDIDGL